MMDMTINSFSQINITAAPDPNGSVYAELFQSLTNMRIVVFSLVSCLGVLWNRVDIWVTTIKMKKTVNTFQYLNLAVADFFFASSLPLSVIHHKYGLYEHICHGLQSSDQCGTESQFSALYSDFTRMGSGQVIVEIHGTHYEFAYWEAASDLQNRVGHRLYFTRSNWESVLPITE